MKQLFLYIIIFFLPDALRPLKMVPGRSSALEFPVILALEVRPLRGLYAVPLCAWALMWLEDGSVETVIDLSGCWQNLEFMEENRKGVCVMHPHYPQLIRLPVWTQSRLGLAVESVVWPLHLKSLQVDP